MLKKLFGETNEANSTQPKRSRGLGMGVGNFSGGQLKLNREDIQSVVGPSQSSRGRGGSGRGRGRGGGRGRGRGRGR